MNEKPVNVTVVPAQSGFLCVYDMDNNGSHTIEVSDPIIAWRVETYESKSNELFSSCIPLTVEGDVVDNCVGIQNPQGAITTFGGEYFDSLESFRFRHKSKKM